MPLPRSHRDISESICSPPLSLVTRHLVQAGGRGTSAMSCGALPCPCTGLFLFSLCPSWGSSALF